MRTHTFKNTTAVCAPVLALGAALLASPAAHAASTPAASAPVASVVHNGEDNELWYKGTGDEVNDLSVSVKYEERGEQEAYYVITFRDRGEITIDPSAADADECVHPSPDDLTTVRCATPVPLGSDDSDNWVVDLGGGDDTATGDPDSSGYSTVHGGAGNDVLTGSGGDVLRGDGGNDRLTGGGGVWSMGPFGGAGDDIITDCATDCWGGSGNDTMTGTHEQNTMHGEDGNDTVRGGSGHDELLGGRGDDKLYGEGGNDTLWGNSGYDFLSGGTGTDTLSVGPDGGEQHQD